MTEANENFGSKSIGGKKLHPTRGKRYAPAVKREILGFVLWGQTYTFYFVKSVGLTP